MLRTLLATTALLLAVPALAQDGPVRTFTGADLFGLEVAADAQISPDGSRIAYVRRTGDVMTDTMRASIWLIDVASGRQSPLVQGASSPRWSPDGTRLAYVASDGSGGAAQLNVRWMATGASARITGLPQTPSSLAWSPDGTRIAYIMAAPEDAPKLGKAPPKPEGAKWAEPLQVIDKVTYRADSGGYLKPGYDHLFVVSADGGAPRQLTFGKFHDDGPLSWTPDGRAILFAANRRADWEREFMDSEVQSIDVASGAIRPLTKRYGPDYAPQVSPDGSRIAYLGYDDTRRSNNLAQLHVMNRDGSGARNLTANLDRSLDTVVWAPDGRSLIVSYDDKGEKVVARVGVDGGTSRIARGLAGAGLDRPYTGGSFSVSDKGTVAYTGGDAARPADVWIATGEGRRLTRLNDDLIASKAMAQVRKLAVTAPDGRAIDAWLATPPGYVAGSRVPLILEIHGGPHSAYGPAFSTDVQLYAAAGYAVLYTNPRGSTSYGLEFANLIDKKYPGEDYDDLIASVDAAIAAGIADPDNLFVTGGSGGGVLTTWIVGKTNRFKAAAAQKPVINWISEALTMDNTVFTSRYWFSKLPWEDPMSYWSRSPLSLVGSINTPTLVVVGSEDYRTPVSESEQLYAALQIKGVPTALVKVPGASHGGFTARPSQSAAKASAILDWFDRYQTRKAVPPAQ